MFILFFLAVSMLYKLKNLEPILLEFLENVIESRFWYKIESLREANSCIRRPRSNHGDCIFLDENSKFYYVVAQKIVSALSSFFEKRVYDFEIVHW